MGRVAALLGFKDEVGAAVEVDAALRGGAVEVVEGDGFFEDVGVAVVFSAGGIGAGNVEEVAELGEEELVVGALGGSGLTPALGEAGGEGGHREDSFTCAGLPLGW